ncbi:GNAT family N-acetyltransferase [Aerococcaceae bacterium DSM 111022]|nr:GNAT family N-acetyltransferase [Aerococcaceae bacterium DSM 111022]
MSKYQLVPANTNLKDVLKIALFAFKFTYAQEEPESVIDGIHGASMLMEISEDIGDITQIDAWLELQDQLSNLDTVPSDYVPAMTYLYTETERNIIVGIVNIRLALNDYLEQFGGHIGYSIHPDYRGFGYGHAQLKAALIQARELGLNRVLITCDDDNLASSKVIEAQGGVLENIVEHPDYGDIRRYWIDLETI